MAQGQSYNERRMNWYMVGAETAAAGQDVEFPLILSAEGGTSVPHEFIEAYLEGYIAVRIFKRGVSGAEQHDMQLYAIRIAAKLLERLRNMVAKEHFDG